MSFHHQLGFLFRRPFKLRLGMRLSHAFLNSVNALV